MQGKKKYVVLVLLLLIGFGAISFAGGNEDELISSEPSGNNLNNTGDINVDDNNQFSNNENLEIDNYNLEEDLEEIPNDVNNNVGIFQPDRVNNFIGNNVPVVNLETIISQIEDMVRNAKNKEHILAAKLFFNNSNVLNLLDRLNNLLERNNLKERVEKLIKIFQDNLAPIIEGIENNKITKDDVSIEISGDSDVDVVITLNGENIPVDNKFVKEGKYVVSATDLAKNTVTVTFIIDKTKPVLNGLVSGNHYDEFTLDVIDNTEVTIDVIKDHKDVVEASNGMTFTEDGTYKITLTDEAGNANVYWLAIDNQNPTIISEKVEKCNDIIVSDRYLTEVKVNDKTYTRSDFTHDNHNEYFEYKEKVCVDGTYTVIAKDKIGNDLSQTFEFDGTAPIVNYVAVLSKKDNYNKAIKGDTIRFLIQFNEEIFIPENKEDRTFKLKIDGKEVLFQRSQGAGFEYIAEYKIPQDSTMENGELKFEIVGYKDKFGNMGEPVSEAKHYKYNSVYYDGIEPTIKLVGNQGRNKNEHRVIAGSQIKETYVYATVSDNDLDKPLSIAPSSIKRCYPAEAKKACHDYKPENGVYDTSGVGERYNITYTYTDASGYTVSRTMLLVMDDYKNPTPVNGVIELTKNVNNGYIPFYNVLDNMEPVTINGNGHSVTQNIVEDAFYWQTLYNDDNNLNRAMLGNVFSSLNNSKITINDLTFKGITNSISLGHYKNSTYVKYNTELNNVNIVDLDVVSYSAPGIAPAVMLYGIGTFNNVNLYGTKLSDLDQSPRWPVYDLAVGNYSNAIINNSKIGSVFTWEQATMTIKNSTVDYIYTKMWNNKGGLIVDEGSVVDNITVASNIVTSNTKKVLITVKSGAVVNTIDLSKSNYNEDQIVIDIQPGGTVKNIIKK